MARPVVQLDGRTLSCSQVRDVARGTAAAAVTGDGRERTRAAARTAAEVAARSQVYGRTTGVGANRDQVVSPADLEGHGLRLLRSHAGGGGPLIAAELSRAMLVVRVNQIAAGGSGVDPGIFDPLLAGINDGLSVPVPRYGAIGTGDLTALAVTALCLLGERDWLPAGSRQPRFALAPADALALLSSNAATVGEAALACSDLMELVWAAIVIAALSHRAVTASIEPYAAAVHEAGVTRAAGGRGRAEGAARGGRPRRPDPGPLRLPGLAAGARTGHRRGQACRPGRDRRAERRGGEPADRRGRWTVWHNGNFHTAYLGLALDAVRAALFQTAALSAARLGTLVEPAFTGLAPFLATDPPPSSGIMILEYVAHSAIADIRRLAAPAALGSAVLSRGVEEHAGFSTQSARATTEVIDAYRIVLACELVASVRALRLRGPGRARRPGRAFDLAAGALPPNRRPGPGHGSDGGAGLADEARRVRPAPRSRISRR